MRELEQMTYLVLSAAILLLPRGLAVPERDEDEEEGENEEQGENEAGEEEEEEEAEPRRGILVRRIGRLGLPGRFGNR